MCRQRLQFPDSPSKPYMYCVKTLQLCLKPGPAFLLPCSDCTRRPTNNTTSPPAKKKITYAKYLKETRANSNNLKEQ